MASFFRYFFRTIRLLDIHLDVHLDVRLGIQLDIFRIPSNDMLFVYELCLVSVLCPPDCVAKKLC